MKYPKYMLVAVSLFVVILVVIGVFMLRKDKESFKGTEVETTYPKTVVPVSHKVGTVMINNASYYVKFMNTEVSRGVKRYVMITPDSSPDGQRVFYMDASTGSIHPTPNTVASVKNMI